MGGWSLLRMFLLRHTGSAWTDCCSACRSKMMRKTFCCANWGHEAPNACMAIVEHVVRGTSKEYMLVYKFAIEILALSRFHLVPLIYRKHDIHFRWIPCYQQNNQAKKQKLIVDGGAILHLRSESKISTLFAALKELFPILYRKHIRRISRSRNIAIIMWCRRRRGLCIELGYRWWRLSIVQSWLWL